MSFDTIIRGGTVIDGSGLAGYRADVGIVGDRIARIGRIRESAPREIDATGQVVTPGFIDGHTHMDVQMLWDDVGGSSCWHGVTTVVMGNCGYTLAPCTPTSRDLILQTLEKAEDIPRDVMAAVVDWRWESFRSYLDVIDGVPKGINYAANIGHSALRTWAMGERAFGEAATEDDVRAMRAELADAMAAGAIGFTTSRSPTHVMTDGRPVASRYAEWDEVVQLVDVLGELGTGLFELEPEGAGRGEDPDAKRDWFERLGGLAIDTGVPVLFGVFAVRDDERSWTDALAFIDDVSARGGRMYGQCHSRDISNLPSFRTKMPFDRLPVWSDVRALSPEEQVRAFRDPALRAKLVEAAQHGPYVDVRAPDYDLMQVFRTPLPGGPTVNEEAAARGVDPVDVILDAAVETDLGQLYRQPGVNYRLDDVLGILRHPRTIMTFSDAGAHVSIIMDASIHTTLLAYWVRERQELTLEEAVRMITLQPAAAWGFSDRGLLREGMVADLNVFDPDEIGPEMPEIVHDLPTGAPRFVQSSRGISTTMVGGEVLISEGRHTGAHPGRLLRGPLAGGGR